MAIVESSELAHESQAQVEPLDIVALERSMKVEQTVGTVFGLPLLIGLVTAAIEGSSINPAAAAGAILVLASIFGLVFISPMKKQERIRQAKIDSGEYV